MLFHKSEDAKVEFSLEIDDGRPRLMCRSQTSGWWAYVLLNRSEAISAAKLLIDAAETMPRKESIFYCSFCGKSQHDVGKLIAGPNYVFICNECTGLCADLVCDAAAIQPQPVT